MAATPVPTIDAAGITKQPFSAWQTYFREGFKAIYGSDVYFAPDDRDTQFLDMLATAADDVCAAIVADFGSRDPSQAIGEGLSSVVKINGLARLIPSFSLVDLLVVGVVGTIISNGLVSDDAGVVWALPDEVEIPRAGQIVVSATCTQKGAIAAAPGTIRTIMTPVVGWQTVANPTAASPGQPVEKDAWLRQRQAASTQIPAVSPIDALRGALLELGVSDLRLYENDAETSDRYGIPPKALACVALGGDSAAIATVLATQKGIATPTFGTTAVGVADSAGASKIVRFSRPRDIAIGWRLHISALEGFTVDHKAAIQAAVAAWTVALGIGAEIKLDRAQLPVLVDSGVGARFFRLNSIAAGRDALLPGEADIALAFDERPRCLASFVQVILDP